ncbi:MAG: hypothetical protein ACO1QR_05800 [Chthoniobacteraceae bacterium]
MKYSSFLSAELKALAAFTFLLPLTIAPICAQEVVPPPIDIPPAAAASAASIEELRDELIASVRADLLAKREKEENAAAVTMLAQAIEALASQATPGRDAPLEWLEFQQRHGNGGRTSWQTAIQAHGSEKSMKLGIQYARRQQREAAENVARRGAEVEATAKKAAQQVFSAKTAAELDPIIDEIAPLTQQPALITGVPQDVVGKVQQFHQFLTAWQSHLAAREAGNPEQALQALRQFRSEQRTVPWVPRSELVKQVDAARRATGVPGPDDAAEAIKRITEKALEANKGETIDPLLLEMRKLQAMMQTEEYHAQANQAQQLVSFLESWQKALILSETGNITGFKEALQQLEGYGTRGLDIPRSKLLARLYALNAKPEAKSADGKPATPVKIEPPQAVLDRIQRLEDLEPTLVTLNSAVELLPPSERNQWARIVQELQTVGRQYAEVRNGLATRVNLGMNTTGAADPKVLDLQRQLSLLSLHRLLGEDAKMEPQAEENSITYLRRMLAAAKERNDWRLVQRIMETAQSTNVQDPLLRTTDSAAISSFLAATTQERAGQFAFATASYLGSLKTGSEWLPVEEIGERLRAIEKEHAEDYAQGVEWARTPPVSNYPQGYYPPGRPPTVPYGSQRRIGEQSVLIPEKKPPVPKAEEAEK